MKKVQLLLSCLIMASPLFAQRLYPVVKSSGGVQDAASFSINYTDPEIEYKIVTESGRPPGDSSKVYRALEFMAKMVNLHDYAGVPEENRSLSFVLFAGSTGVALDNEAYREIFKVDNPNVHLIEELTEAGVEIIVCGQSIMNWDLDPESINPKIKIAVSRLTAVTSLQMKGYGFFKL